MKTSEITALDFFNDLSSRYARRRFFWSFVVLGLIFLILICLTNVFVTWPKTNDFLVSIQIEILSGLLIILGFYGLYYYFIGPNTAAREVSVTRSHDINKQMKVLPLGANKYMHWGRSGAFFRACPLLELDKQATANKHNVEIEILLPDPLDARLVKSYREILKSLGEDMGENPLLANVLATCMACAILESNNMYLKIRIHLSSFLPAFRFDLSDNGAIVTQDDKKKSALYFESGSEFYEMFRNTMINEREISREIKWCKNLFDGLKLVENSCNETTLKAFKIDVPDENLDKIQSDVARLITERPHRYK